VWHKRRVDFKKFFRQVYVFGMSRITLRLLYPDSLKAVHLLPAVFVAGTVLLLVLGLFCSPWWLVPLGVYFLAIFIGALITTRNIKIAAMAVPAAIIQLGGYGIGFIKAFIEKIILRRGRNVAEEIEIRRGK
ncbi:MAG: glycosyl transferase family 2, partial [Muribaculaceae bacterium]|nr:glycosyl transferase family 2 [Muribaculaceae bacterium]